jgi:hypothetical protein
MLTARTILAVSFVTEVAMTGATKTAQAGASGAGAVYGLGFIGALVYYWQHAGGLWAHLWAIFEAILWPAFVVYDLLKHLSG